MSLTPEQDPSPADGRCEERARQVTRLKEFVERVGNERAQAVTIFQSFTEPLRLSLEVQHLLEGYRNALLREPYFPQQAHLVQLVDSRLRWTQQGRLHYLLAGELYTASMTALDEIYTVISEDSAFFTNDLPSYAYLNSITKLPTTILTHILVLAAEMTTKRGRYTTEGVAAKLKFVVGLSGVSKEWRRAAHAPGAQYLWDEVVFQDENDMRRLGGFLSPHFPTSRYDSLRTLVLGASKPPIASYSRTYQTILNHLQAVFLSVDTLKLYSFAFPLPIPSLASVLGRWSSNLRKLHIRQSSINSEVLQGLFCSLVRVEKLEFASNESAPSSSGSLQLPYASQTLRSLQIHHCLTETKEELVHGLVSVLQVPNLTHFTLDVRHNYTSSSTPDHVAPSLFNPTLFSPLRSFAGRGSFLSDEYVLRLLETATCLQTLDVSYSNALTNLLLERLSDPARPPIALDLTSLWIIACPLVNADGIEPFVLKRWDCVDPAPWTKRIFLEFGGAREDDEVEIRRLRVLLLSRKIRLYQNREPSCGVCYPDRCDAFDPNKHLDVKHCRLEPREIAGWV